MIDCAQLIEVIERRIEAFHQACDPDGCTHAPGAFVASLADAVLARMGAEADNEERQRINSDVAYWQDRAHSAEAERHGLLEQLQVVVAMLWPWLGSRKRRQIREGLKNIHRTSRKSGPKPKGAPSE